jgi:fucose permease
VPLRSPSYSPHACKIDFWRDLGYAVGALSAGIIADLFGMARAIGIIGAFTFVSGTIVAALMTTAGREP